MKIRNLWPVPSVLLLSFLAAAQEPPSPEAAVPAEQTAERDPIQAIIDQEVAPAPGQYTYQPEGRRDPFVSLINPVGGSGRPGVPQLGIEGFLIQETALKGIVKTPEGFIAMMLGGDGKSYFVKVNQRFYDGVITAMDYSTVTFRQEVTDPLSPVRSRDVKKSLYPNEEAP